MLAVDIPTKTYGEALEEELRSLAAKQSNFPLFTKREHQENDGVLLSLASVSSMEGSVDSMVRILKFVAFLDRNKYPFILNNLLYFQYLTG